MARPHPGLDNPLLQGRLRNHNRRSIYERRVAVAGRPQVISDIRKAPASVLTAASSQPLAPVASVSPKPYASAAHGPYSYPQHHAGQHLADNGKDSKPQRHRVVPEGMAAQAREPVLVITAAPIISDIKRRVALLQPQPVSAVLHPRHMPSKVLMREAVQPRRGKQLRMVQFKKLKYSLKNKAITALALVVVVTGLGIGLYGLKANHAVATEAKQLSQKSEEAHGEVAGATSDIPAETSPPNVSTYQVAATLPKIITIEKIGTHGRIVRLGVRADNRLATPANIFDTGWYEASSKPGEAGAMLIDGHVSGPTRPGVFYGLKKLVSGDKITVERGDGKVFTYKVVKTKSYAADQVDMAAAITPVTSGKSGLNLITCTGEIDASHNHYEDRLVVFAEQI